MENDNTEWVIVPPDKLRPEIIDRLLEEFITREGTDYGGTEYSLVDKTSQVKKQLHQHKIKIVFNLKSEEFNLLTEHQLSMYQLNSPEV